MRPQCGLVPTPMLSLSPRDGMNDQVCHMSRCSNTVMAVCLHVTVKINGVFLMRSTVIGAVDELPATSNSDLICVTLTPSLLICSIPGTTQSFHPGNDPIKAFHDFIAVSSVHRVLWLGNKKESLSIIR